VASPSRRRLPERVAAVVAYEPPYGRWPTSGRGAPSPVARATAAAAATGGPPPPARIHARGRTGAWHAMPERTRIFLEGEAEARGGRRHGDLIVRAGGHRCPVAIRTGAASEPFYAPLADALAARIPGARRAELAGLRHTAPITDPAPIAVACRAALDLALGVAADGRRSTLPPLQESPA
jgi:hypothetical protein